MIPTSIGKIFFSFLFICVLVSSSVASVVSTDKHNSHFLPSSIDSGNTIYVSCRSTDGDGSREHPYQYIHQAMDVAQNGDTIYVFNGTYDNELYLINKSINLIGENKDTTIINHYDNKPIMIEADYVNFSGFQVLVTAGGITSMAKIWLNNANYCTVSNNRFITYFMALCTGILTLTNAHHNIIKDNNLNDDGKGNVIPRLRAIWIDHSSDNLFENNYLPWFVIAIININGSNNNVFVRNNVLYGHFTVMTSSHTVISESIVGQVTPVFSDYLSISHSDISVIAMNQSNQVNISNNILLHVSAEASHNISVVQNNFKKYSLQLLRETGRQLDARGSDILLENNY